MDAKVARVARHVFVYIDETGDRGCSDKSSPIFGMAAIVVDAPGGLAMRTAVDRLRCDFKVPQGKVMSWKEHVKTHDRRRHAARVLGELVDVRVCYVYSVKQALRTNSYLVDPRLFYDYVAYKTYKSALWAARAWKGPQVEVWTRFGHVKGHDHRSTESYIREARRRPIPRFPMRWNGDCGGCPPTPIGRARRLICTADFSRRLCGPAESSIMSNPPTF